MRGVVQDEISDILQHPGEDTEGPPAPAQEEHATRERIITHLDLITTSRKSGP